MTHKFALAGLLGILLLVGWLFLQVIQPFLMSLFVAAILAVMFRPAYERLTKFLGGRSRIAAMISTIGIVVLILLPIGTGLILAGRELVDVGREFTTVSESPRTSQLGQVVDRVKNSWAGRWFDRLKSRLNEEQQASVNNAVVGASTGIIKELSEKTAGFLADVVAASVGLAVMVLALYYFLADGEHFLAQLEYFSPLKYEDDLAIWRQFVCLSRSVVSGTIIAGLIQSVLAAIGFIVVGVERVWLLAALTWLASLLPFVGAATIWVVVCVGLIIDQHYWAAGILAVYGTVVVSSSDNLVRAYLIGSDSKLHPLLVLVSTLGALKFIGLWGIFIGPMIAGIFYALLKILRKRLPENATPLQSEQARPCDVDCETVPQEPEAKRPSETDCLYLV